LEIERHRTVEPGRPKKHEPVRTLRPAHGKRSGNTGTHGEPADYRRANREMVKQRFKIACERLEIKFLFATKGGGPAMASEVHCNECSAGNVSEELRNLIYISAQTVAEEKRRTLTGYPEVESYAVVLKYILHHTLLKEISKQELASLCLVRRSLPQRSGILTSSSPRHNIQAISPNNGVWALSVAIAACCGRIWRSATGCGTSSR
jgi:hypothetical protein